MLCGVVGVTSWAGQHLHQLVRHTSLSHSVNQGLNVPETVDGSKLQQSFPVPLQSHLLEIPVPKKKKKMAWHTGGEFSDKDAVRLFL